MFFTAYIESSISAQRNMVEKLTGSTLTGNHEFHMERANGENKEIIDVKSHISTNDEKDLTSKNNRKTTIEETEDDDFEYGDQLLRFKNKLLKRPKPRKIAENGLLNFIEEFKKTRKVAKVKPSKFKFQKLKEER